MKSLSKGKDITAATVFSPYIHMYFTHFSFSKRRCNISGWWYSLKHREESNNNKDINKNIIIIIKDKKSWTLSKNEDVSLVVLF